LRFVLDTNVVVSALLLRDSVPRQAFDKALAQGKILVSLPVIFELADVLSRSKLNRYLLEEERMRFLVTLLKEAELAQVRETITACRDAKDDKFLDLAVSGRASFIVTGDADLLELGPFRDILIVTPREFLTKPL
jgi:putative PIN family toxin of toxin-antitoxin system